MPLTADENLSKGKGGQEGKEKKKTMYSRFKQQQPDSVTLAVWILFGISLRVATDHVGTW